MVPVDNILGKVAALKNILENKTRQCNYMDQVLEIITINSTANSEIRPKM